MVNLVLDCVAVFAFGMGITGAALSTTVAQWAGLAYLVNHVRDFVCVVVVVVVVVSVVLVLSSLLRLMPLLSFAVCFMFCGAVIVSGVQQLAKQCNKSSLHNQQWCRLLLFYDGGVRWCKSITHAVPPRLPSR